MDYENQDNEDWLFETIDVKTRDSGRRQPVFTASPLWCNQKKCLIYVDNCSNRICVYRPPVYDSLGGIVSAGRVEYMNMTHRIGFAIPTLRSCGDSCLFLLVGLEDSVVEVNFTDKVTLRCVSTVRDPSPSSPPPSTPAEAAGARGRLCIGTCASDGTLFTGYVTYKGQEASKGRLYYLNVFGDLTSAIRSEHSCVPSGSAWLGYDTFFFTDGGSNKVYKCRLQENDGIKSLTDRKIIFKLSKESSDVGHRLGGVAIDIEGKLWIALTGGSCILRVDPVSGKEVYRLSVPMKYPTSCAFGGYGLSDMYVTFRSQEGATHADSSVDEGAVLVLAQFIVSGGQGSAMADLPEKEVPRLCTPVHRAEAGMQ